jgi:hypothetical protein
LQQNSVADFSMKNGRENRTNGNQEKGKEEKEALRGQYEVKGGRQKRPLSFLRGSLCDGINPKKGLHSSHWKQHLARAFRGRDISRERRRRCSGSRASV